MQIGCFKMAMVMAILYCYIFFELVAFFSSILAPAV